VYFCRKEWCQGKVNGGKSCHDGPASGSSRSDLIAAAARQLGSGFDKLTWRLVCVCCVHSAVAIRCGSPLPLDPQISLVVLPSPIALPQHGPVDAYPRNPRCRPTDRPRREACSFAMSLAARAILDLCAWLCGLSMPRVRSQCPCNLQVDC